MEWTAVKFRARPYAVAFALAAIAAVAQAALSKWGGTGAGALALYMPAIVGSALLGLGPGVLALGVIEFADWTLWRGGLASAGGVAELALFGVGSALTVAILGSNWRARAPAADPLFKAVQDISIEGVAVYRAALDRAGRIVDFEYRYANPAACAIMQGRPADIAGERLLERLPEARDHPQLFPRYVRVFETGKTSEAEYELGGRWFHSTVARLGDGLVVTVQDVSARKRADESQKLLLAELNHRVMNLLASVIAMVAQAERGASSTADFRDKLSARLHALSRAHHLLSAGAWSEAGVGDVVRSTLEPHLGADPTRFQIDGGAFKVTSDTALALNMALHELATNAVKYGALSGPQGRVAIRWFPDPDRPGFVRLIWRESGGPSVSEPERSGFGTRLLGRAFAASGGEAKVRFPPDGVVCEMVFATLEASPGAFVAGGAAKSTSEGGPPGP
ncbi:MAG TPA: HWE histidine kinase domain-containing protein [Roseiarcus sp.]|nr:HWE histidine kinase domain-containing protein [Roseiarcus sp.]